MMKSPCNCRINMVRVQKKLCMSEKPLNVFEARKKEVRKIVSLKVSGVFTAADVQVSFFFHPAKGAFTFYFLTGVCRQRRFRYLKKKMLLLFIRNRVTSVYVDALNNSNLAFTNNF